jgi:hypothetical protein
VPGRPVRIAPLREPLRGGTATMTLYEILAVALVVTAGWLVWDGLKARETAYAAMRAACRRAGFLFLDDTVALASIRPVRDAAGRVQLRRIFRFEYSDTGHDRHKGSLTMVGEEIAAVDLGPTRCAERDEPD